MTRMKSLTIGAIATTMILGSSIVLAGGPGEPAPGDPTVDSATTTTVDVSDATVIELANPAPPRRGGGGSGRALKK